MDWHPGPSARRIGVALVGLTAVTSALVIPLRVDQLADACEAGSACAPVWVAALDVAAVAAYLVLALVLILRTGGDRMAFFVGIWFTGLALDTFPLPTLADRWPVFDRVDLFNQRVSVGIGIVLFAALFPDGRFVPRWSRWVVVAAVAQESIRIVVPDAPVNSPYWSDGAQALELFAWILVIVWMQLHRYRRVSGPVERQQTKWVVLGFAAVLGANLVAAVLALAAPDTFAEGSRAALVVSSLLDLSLLVTPLAIGAAILRYRLFDIGRVVSRTVTYSIVVSLLGVAYFAMSTLVSQVVPSDSGVVVAAATLLVAAAFAPLRRRVQRVVDRRFNRTHFLAAQVVSGFGATINGLTDAGEIHRALLDTTADLFAPEAIGLWVQRVPGTIPVVTPSAGPNTGP